MAKLKIEDNVLIECIPEDEDTDIVISEGVEKNLLEISKIQEQNMLQRNKQ